MLQRSRSQAVARHRTAAHGDDIETVQSDPSQPHSLSKNLQSSIGSTNALPQTSWSRFNRAGEQKIKILPSLRAIALSSWLNVFLVFLPLGWLAHFGVIVPKKPGSSLWSDLTFAFCFLGIMPLQKFFEYGGRQIACYVGVELGDLLVISLSNVVEATLAIVLLVKGELRLLQSTVIGVVVLHLLLIPGVSFLVGGARVDHQELHPRFVLLNQTLLSIGVLTVVIPAAIFAALDRPVIAAVQIATTPVVSDASRHIFLNMSRILSIVLLILYICSRIFLHTLPAQGEESKKDVFVDAEDPEVNQYVCIVMLALSIGLLAATMEWLVAAVEIRRSNPEVKLEWFGLIILPFLSFAADGVVAVLLFLSRHFFKGRHSPEPEAQANAIDLSIQFLLFWMPFLVILGWCIERPLSLLFDFFEVAILVCSCLAVNYVVADAKTNWAEGLAMMAFYVMIAVGAWYYPGEPSIRFMLAEGSVEEALLEAMAAANSTS